MNKRQRTGILGVTIPIFFLIGFYFFGEVSASLVDSGDVLESHPVQRNLRLIFDDNDNCEALKKSNFYFDIDNLQIADDNRVKLNFTGADFSFFYEY